MKPNLKLTNSLLALIAGLIFAHMYVDNFYRGPAAYETERIVVHSNDHYRTQNVVTVLGPVHTPYDGMGAGSSGSLVMGPNGIDFVEMDFGGFPSLVPGTGLKVLLRTNIDGHDYFDPLLPGR